MNIAEFRRETANCRNCPLHLRRTHLVMGSGDHHRKIMVVTLRPTKAADQSGQYWDGKETKNVSSLLTIAGLDKNKVYATSLIPCYCPDDTDQEELDKYIGACVDWLDPQIAIIKPKLILVVGTVLSNRLLGEIEPGVPIEQYGMIWYAVPSPLEADTEEKQQAVVDHFVNLRELLSSFKLV